MANQLSLAVSGTWTQGNLTDSFLPQLGALTLNAQGMAGGIQSIGTAEENLGAGDIVTNGMLFLFNLDATNYVQWGMSDAGTMKSVGKLKGGATAASCALLYVDAGVTVRLKANTGACNVYYKWLND
jgi:hypothetical protein